MLPSYMRKKETLIYYIYKKKHSSELLAETCFAVKHLHVPEDIPEGRSRNEIVQFPSLLKLIPVTQRGRLELGVAIRRVFRQMFQ